MTCSTALRGAVLLLAGMFHATQSWDSSNIWFPDTNNPVFYNMTFYQQAAQTVADNTDNLIPGPPTRVPETDRQRPRPAVFNRLPETPPTPTRRPDVVQRVKQPARNRQPPTTTTSNGRFPDSAPSQSDIGRVIAEQEAFLRHEKNPPRFFGTPARDSNPAATQSGIERLAAEQRAFIRAEQSGGGYTAAPPSGSRRYSADQHGAFVRDEWRPEYRPDERRPEYRPDVAVGYKTVPLEETTAAGTQAYQHTDSLGAGAGNRLRRTKNDGIADAGRRYDNNNNGRYAEERRWSLARPEATADQRSFTRPVQRAVVPVDENRRRWNSAGSTTNGGDASYRVEDNLIADRGPPTKPAGPSKCVWAIISCCKPSSPQIRYTCFETLGCHGAFWDTSPCSKEMTMAAVQATANFYNIPRSVD